MRNYSALGSSISSRDGGLPGDKDDLLKNQFVTETTDAVSWSRRPNLRDSIGPARIYILALGIAGILTATTLLALLWAGAAIAIRQGDPGQTWRFVVNRGWAPITVTVCAAAIRTAISLQAGVAMSMIASALLEKHHVELGDSVFLSIVRAVSIQPFSLLFTGGRGVLKSSGLLGFPLIIVASLIAIASTFTSSILLSDFGNVSILGDFNTSMIGYTNESVATALDMWRSPPGQYARFAEYTNSSRAMGQHVDDTGLTWRVPLPMAASNERETLREYTGPATVFDNRVICVAPQMTLSSLNGSMDSSRTGGLLSVEGHVTFDSNLPPPLRGAEPGKQLPFICLLPRTEPTPHLMWNITVCVVTPPPSTSDSLSSPLSIAPSILRANLTTYHPPIFFILNVTAPVRENGFKWNDFLNTYFDEDANQVEGYSIPQDALVVTTEGPWAKAKVEGIDTLDDVVFSATACVTTTQGVPYNVTLTSQSDGAEPTLGWSGALLSEGQESIPQSTYDTTAVRYQLNALGGSALSRRERGVMNLDYAATDWGKPLDEDAIFPLNPQQLFPTFDTLPLCPQECSTDPSAVMAIDVDRDVGHPVHVSLFHDALAATGSPALALQSWLTTLTRQRFYDSLGRFTAGAEARYAQSVEVFAPQQWKGFIGVMTMLVCHLLVILWATIWYLRAARNTMLGNSWQAVSQVVSDATLPVLWRATDLKDAEVETIIREEMAPAQRYGIARLRKTDRRELVAMPSV